MKTREEVKKGWAVGGEKESDRADLTIKQTLELDFLFWQTAMKKKEEAGGEKKRGHRVKEKKEEVIEKSKKSEAARLISVREKNEAAARDYRNRWERGNWNQLQK